MFKQYRMNCHADVLSLFEGERGGLDTQAVQKRFQRYLERRLVVRPAVMPVTLIIAWMIHVFCVDGWSFIGAVTAAYTISLVLFLGPLWMITCRLSRKQSTYCWDQMHQCFAQEPWTWLTYCGVPAVFLLNFTLLGVAPATINHIFIALLIMTVLVNARMIVAVASRESFNRTALGH